MGGGGARGVADNTVERGNCGADGGGVLVAVGASLACNTADGGNWGTVYGVVGDGVGSGEYYVATRGFAVGSATLFEFAVDHWGVVVAGIIPLDRHLPATQ